MKTNSHQPCSISNGFAETLCGNVRSSGLSVQVRRVLGLAMTTAVMGSLAFPLSKAEAFQNGRAYLWETVVRECTNNPPPNSKYCNVVIKTNDGYVITKPDKSGRKDQTLLIPKDPISGIEAYSYMGTYLPNYFNFAIAYGRKHYLSSWVAVAMNSANTRSQDQLHLHICQADGAVVATIQKFLGSNPLTPDVWYPWPLVELQPGHRYHVMKLTSTTVNPFEKAFKPKGGTEAADKTFRGDVNLALLADQANNYYLFYNTDGGAAEALLANPCTYS